MKHATVKLGEHQIPLIGVPPDATDQKCEKCGKVVHLSDSNLQGNKFLCGECLKQAGQKQVSANNEMFLADMRGAAVRIATEKGSVTCDDLRELAVKMGISPSHPNAWGTIFRGIWRVEGLVRSRIPSNHSRLIRVWKLRGSP